MGEILGETGLYEVKFQDPDGIIVDVTHNGWEGSIKKVAALAGGKPGNGEDPEKQDDDEGGGSDGGGDKPADPS